MDRPWESCLADSWQAKKLTASGITTERIETLCEIGFAHGALASKVSGAGGGGFLMFVVRPEDRLGLVTALSAAGGEAGPVKVTERGSETWQRFTGDNALSSRSRTALDASA